MVDTLVLEASVARRESSSLSWGTKIYAGIAQLVERNLAKVEVASSRLVSRSSVFRSVAQSGSAPGLGPGGPRFESLYSDQFASLAQW